MRELWDRLTCGVVGQIVLTKSQTNWYALVAGKINVPEFYELYACDFHVSELDWDLTTFFAGYYSYAISW